MMITMTSPITDVKLCAVLFLYVHILFWAQFQHCSFSCSFSWRFAEMAFLLHVGCAFARPNWV